jgi:ComF family protein
MLFNYFNRLQNWLLPPTCIFCNNQGVAGKDICKLCLQQLPRNLGCCNQCGGHLVSSHQMVCDQCTKNPPLYQRTVAPFVYAGAIKHLILQLKSPNHYSNARLLGNLLAEPLQHRVELPECIIPVPLHKNRYQERGFNQSTEIARTVAKQLNLHVDLNACIRQRDTPHQIGLSAKQRNNNIKEAFVVPHSLPYQHVAILDDVLTTGATTGEIAKVLTQAGVSHIEIWVCAKTQQAHSQ